MSEIKKTETELAVTSSFVNAEGIELLREALADDCQGMDFSFDKITIPTGGVTMFQMPDEKKNYFIKFNVDGLLRGDYQSRMSGYSVGIQNGFLSPNDVRELENMDLIPDELGGNRYLCNGNMIGIGSARKRDSEPQENTDTEQRTDKQESDTNNEE